MDKSLTYTSSEVDMLLSDFLKESNDKIPLSIYGLKTILEVINKLEETNEQTIFSKILSKKRAAEYMEIEPYGEGKVFTILYDRGMLEFKFCTRHLKRFLYEYSLEDMPLLINTYFIGILAIWRLKIAK